MISKQQKEEIIAALSRQAPTLECPICHGKSFTIMDGFTVFSLQDNLNSIVIGNPSLPVISIVCTKCGFVSSHALGALGLLPHKGNSDTETKK